MCILSYIYGSNSLELGEDIELFYVVQDFCLVTVCGKLVDGRYKCLYLAQILALELADALEACTAENLNTNYYIMPDPMCRQKLSKVKA